ncbi:hypothetical protein ST201phi2-1p096 [Pseudomonas phage 201phi2-1]|uniref:Uncharacterized protein n=1 Tax=Pseudomonas phage 201phi2-1 TaxID=198110 RepID=B3FIW0_BP201|nr:hypothetical protein ST201phi2-1p096 [Pseudomonas phage 201phi2-1]ABY62929.1 hypothetical protein 201phi2-1p096 [Pseudomonas phage 201phi2-1]
MDNEYMIRGGDMVHISQVGSTPSFNKDGLSMLWHIKNVEPSTDEYDDDYGFVPTGRDKVFIVSAETYNAAVQLHLSNMGMEHHEYAGSQWTIEYIGIDQRDDQTSKFILCA